MASQRDADQIQADLGATRDRLAASLEALVDQVHPNRVKQRTSAKVRGALDSAAVKARSLVFNARGDLRTERLAKVGGGAAGAVVLLVLVRALSRR